MILHPHILSSGQRAILGEAGTRGRADRKLATVTQLLETPTQHASARSILEAIRGYTTACLGPGQRDVERCRRQPLTCAICAST